MGDIGQETCAGNDVVGFGRSLRDALLIRYRFRLPKGPGTTNADETPAGDNVWVARYGDCPPFQASSGGGSASTLVNGLILAGLTGLLMIVFALCAVRRRPWRARKYPLKGSFLQAGGGRFETGHPSRRAVTGVDHPQQVRLECPHSHAAPEGRRDVFPSWRSPVTLDAVVERSRRIRVRPTMATAGPSLRGGGPSRHGDPSYPRSRVGVGQVIGTVGNSSDARYGAPHLHFALHPGGGAAAHPYPHLVAVDPTARAQASVSG